MKVSESIDRYLKDKVGHMNKQKGEISQLLRQASLGLEEERVDRCIDAIRENAIDLICGKKKKSNNEYEIFNRYFKYLEEKKKETKVTGKIRPLPRQLSPLERKLALTKIMQDSTTNFEKEEVAKEFLTTTRTIENDLRELSEGIKVMDQSLQIEFERKNKKIKKVSTVHPLFLAQNLTQIVLLLEGLGECAKVSENRGYAERTAVSIWMQLSDYAKNRIINVLVELMHLDKEWFETIAHRAGNTSIFYSEPECSFSDAKLEAILYAYKGGLECSITYFNDKNERVDSPLAYIVDNTTEVIKIKVNDMIQEIKKDKIIEVQVETEFR